MSQKAGARRKHSRQGRASSSKQARSPRLIVLALAVAAVLGLFGVAALLLTRPSASSEAAWSRLGTDDVHSLAFVGDDPNRLLFGHHGGLLASADGGRSWQPLQVRSDAMSLGAASDGSIVIAGHDEFAQSDDAGKTWQPIPAQLPSLDIHGFARDPANGQRMWAYLATGGLWASSDGGASWDRVQEQNIAFPVAVSIPSGTRLFGVTATGLARSDDDGRTWQAVASPELYPIASLAATPDGKVLVAGGPDGLARSDDGAASWSKLPFSGQAFAVAAARGGQTIGVVDRSTEFFRSDDGGRTWAGP